MAEKRFTVTTFTGPDGPWFRANVWNEHGYSTNTFRTQYAAELWCREQL